MESWRQTTRAHWSVPRTSCTRPAPSIAAWAWRCTLVRTHVIRRSARVRVGVDRFGLGLGLGVKVLNLTKLRQLRPRIVRPKLLVECAKAFVDRSGKHRYATITERWSVFLWPHGPAPDGDKPEEVAGTRPSATALQPSWVATVALLKSPLGPNPAFRPDSTSRSHALDTSPIFGLHHCRLQDGTSPEPYPTVARHDSLGLNPAGGKPEATLWHRSRRPARFLTFLTSFRKGATSFCSTSRVYLQDLYSFGGSG